MTRINPFCPNSPVAPGMFAGRLAQLNALEQALYQTKAGYPKNFLLTGERGIGKTSLLQYLTYVAKGLIPVESENLKFLVLSLDIDTNTTSLGLIRRIELGLKRELAKTEPTRLFFGQCWEFLQRTEAMGIKVRDSHIKEDSEVLHDQFAYSLATTINRFTQADAPSNFGAKYDGVLLLFDEADNAPDELQLGSFTKLLTERVQKHDCNHLMLGIAGMPEVRDVLRESHASSLRVFDHLQIQELSANEVNQVIDSALTDANKKNTEQTSIVESARIWLVKLSEGYPHFIQQFGYSAFAADTDCSISDDDVTNGAFGKGGALELIGDRFYHHDFYNKIQKDSYRQVLRIMAKKGSTWVPKSDIRNEFKGNITTLDNAIHALRERKIILAQEGVRGMYRLQHTGFAFWIMLHTTAPQELEAKFKSSGEGGGNDL